MSTAQLAGGASGTGSMTVQAPNTNSNQTVTIPDATGTVMVSGNMPAFSAYPSGTQSISSGVYTKVACNTKEFDTANAFDATTNYRFTPQVAGYYQVNGAISPNGTSTGSAVAAIYKNGSAFKYGPYIQTTNANSSVSALIYLNGSTDYIEMYAYVTASVASIGNGASSTYFQASLVRAA